MIYNIIIAVVALVNCATFGLYGMDKIKAVNKQWRISEKRLLKLSMVGPFGSYLGMKVFRHKVKKPRFYVGIPFFALVQIAIILIIMCFL